mgnify:CR=1 FL=1
MRYYHDTHFKAWTRGAKKILMLGVMSACAIFMFWYLQQFGFRFFASEDPVSVLISAPEVVDLSGKEEEEFVVGFAIQNQEVWGSKLTLTYDSTYLAYGKEYKSSGFFPPENSPYELLTEEVSVIDPTQKKVKLAIIAVSPINPADPILRFSFKAKAKTNDEVIAQATQLISLTTESEYFGKSANGAAVKFATPLDRISKSILISKNSLNPSATPVPTGAIILEPSVIPVTLPMNLTYSGITIKIKLQGVGQSTEESVEALVEFQNEAGELFSSKQIFKRADNQTWIASWNPGTNVRGNGFSVRIKGPKHVARKICASKPIEDIPGTYQCKDESIVFVSGENTIDATNIVLLSGDILPQDGIVDSRDVIFIRQNFGNRESEVVKRADLNFDGIIDTQDYVMIQKALSFKYDET